MSNIKNSKGSPVKVGKKKSLRDALLEKLPPKKQQQIMKDYFSAKRKSYIKSSSGSEDKKKDPESTKAKTSAKSSPKFVKKPAENPRAHFSSHVQAELIRSCRYLSSADEITLSGMERNQAEDNKSAVSTSSTLSKQKSESAIRPNMCVLPSLPTTRSVAVETDLVVVKQPEKRSIGSGELNVCPVFTLESLETVNIVVLPKKPRPRMERKGSIIQKAIEMGTDSGLLIGVEEEAKGAGEFEKACERLTEEATNIRNSLCAELDESCRKGSASARVGRRRDMSEEANHGRKSSANVVVAPAPTPAVFFCSSLVGCIYTHIYANMHMHIFIYIYKYK